MDAPPGISEVVPLASENSKGRFSVALTTPSALSCFKCKSKEAAEN
jgi:hypothetical protein